MKIEHLALWVADLERMRSFYIQYFGMRSGEKYVNATKQFTSYFLSFKGSATRLELMYRPDVRDHTGKKEITNGLTHFAISVGSKEKVDQLTEQLREEGYMIAGEPRTTGDGYYESIVLDPEGNHIEITK